MTGKVVATYSTPVSSSVSNNTIFDSSHDLNDSLPMLYSPMQVATAVTFSVGLLQVTRKLNNSLYRNLKNNNSYFLVTHVHFTIRNNKFFVK